ncbi:MAG TPA: tyrosine-type recombinase/integrase [Microthrixaceae bacterium]|nr:tyrosine-type recombinase/integrase [Microthrixaceae bacterium]
MSTAQGSLEGLVADYLAVRRSLGYKPNDTEYILDRFVVYLHDHDADGITVEHALGFAMAPSGASPHWQALRLSVVRGFTRWAQCQDPDIEVPPTRLLPARPTRVAPYIYTPVQVQSLLEATDLLRPQIRAATFRTLIGLMAATGIRTGEVVGLDITSFDKDRHTLRIRGKYDKIRMLPLHPSVIEALTSYLHQRDRLLPAATCPALLISIKGTRLHTSNVQQTFRGLVRHAGLKPASSSCRPRLHDLRHTFAVSTMLDAYRSGADPAVGLPILSTWLHAEPSDTYRYLSGTAELLAAAIERLETIATPDERNQS